MSKGSVFEYLVLYHPKGSTEDPGDVKYSPSRIIVDVQRVIARNQEEVKIIASRSIPEEYLDKIANVEIQVRPFSGG